MIPKHMGKGSKGPAVTVLLSFLAKQATKHGKLPAELKVSDELDDRGIELVILYQTTRGIAIDGVCGPEMRADMLSQGFDFESTARAAGGKTIFVQTIEKKVTWIPRSEK
jgi:murein L,D-transpeptidase YcbB/YkuD